MWIMQRRRHHWYLFILCAAGLCGPTEARADEEAARFMRTVYATYAKVRTLTATFTETQGGVVTMGRLRLMKPNFMRIDYLSSVSASATRAPLTLAASSTTVWDGKQVTFWHGDADDKYFTVWEAHPKAYGMNNRLGLLKYFFGGSPEGPGATSRVVSRRLVKGTAYTLIEFQRQGTIEETVTVYVGPDNLIHRVIRNHGPGLGEGHFEVELQRVKVDEPLTAADFAFTPPAGSSQRPSAVSNFLPVGSMAPAFALPDLDGHTVTLAQLLKDKKAVILHFWFCG